MSVIDNPGNAPLNDRWVLWFEPSADEVTFANAAEDEPALKLTDLTGISDVVVNCRGRIVVADNVSHPELVKPGSGWPMLIPGEQTVTVTGAANWQLTFKALYL